MGYDTFQDEKKVIEQAEVALEASEIEDFRPHFQQLVADYKDLTKTSRRLVRMADRSEEALRQANEDLKLARDAAEAARQETREFIAMISHELRTPLAVLKSEIELLSEGIRKPDEKSLNSLGEEVTHFSHLINDMFELSLSDISALNYLEEECDLGNTLAKTLEQLEPQFTEKNIEVTLSGYQPDQTPFEGDAQRLKQVFSNILKNSCHYTDPEGQLQVTINSDDEQYLIEFSDSKPGLDQTGVDKLFNRFYRGESSRNRATGGAGLGMAICQSITAHHGGAISAHTSPLGGLLIRLVFPRNRS